MKLFSYDGKMEYQKINDEVIRDNYQHYHVLDCFRDHFGGKKILDAGCWTGTLEKAIDERKIKCEIVGIDVNEDALAVAEKKFKNRIFCKVDLANPTKDFLDKYKGYFDTVVFLDVLEHVPAESEVKILKNLKLLLNKNGVLVLSTMLDHKFNFIDPAWFFGHRHYSENQTQKLVSDSGFISCEILKIGNLTWDFDLLLLYIFKHIFRKEYKTPKFIYNKILKGLTPPQKNATRIYLIASS